ncbi:TPA: hypothetical protein ACXIMI_000991 [Stenotrophomonas maltophilia]
MVNRVFVRNVDAALQRSHEGVADCAQGYLNWGGLLSGIPIAQTGFQAGARYQGNRAYACESGRLRVAAWR